MWFCSAVLMVFFLAGCGGPGKPAREFAHGFLADADAARKSMQGHHDDMAAGRGLDDLADGPPFVLIVEIGDAMHLYDVRMGVYRKAAGADAPDADQRILGLLAQARDTLRGCAFQLLIDVKGKLPDYRLHYKYEVEPDPEFILDGVRRDLGIEPHTTPPADSCARYDRLAGQIRKSL